jgi:hypothetical protein
MVVVQVDEIDPQPQQRFVEGCKTYSGSPFTTLPGSLLTEPNFAARNISLRFPVSLNLRSRSAAGKGECNEWGT